MKRVYRSSTNSIVGGVCGGIAEYFDVDPTIVRLAWAALIFLGGTGLVAYLIAWLIIPSEPHESFGRSGLPVESPRYTPAADAPIATEQPVVSVPPLAVTTLPTAEPPIPADVVAEAGSQPFVSGPGRASQPQPMGTMQRSSGGTTLGIILIAGGAFLLARSFLPWLNLHRYWPLILVALGVFIVATSVGGERR